MWNRVALVAALVTGCGDECHIGESQCERGYFVECDDTEGPARFTAYTFCCADECIDTVVDDRRIAVCATTSAPEPQCDPNAVSAHICSDDGRAELWCQGGYAFETPCSADSDCVALPDRDLAICAMGGASDPACRGTDDAHRCDGANIIRCVDGYVVERTACTDPIGTCLELGKGAACSTSTSVDARCPSNAWCEGNIAYECLDNGRLIGELCGADETCVTSEPTPATPRGTSWCDAPYPCEPI